MIFLETLLLTTAETADLLRCSVRSVYNMIRNRGLPSMKLGRKHLIPAKELELWILDNCKANENNSVQGFTNNKDN